MDVIDAARNPTSVFPEWCNPSLLAEESLPAPARARADWLASAMHAWCASEGTSTAATPSSH